MNKKTITGFSAVPVERWYSGWFPYCDQAGYQLCHKTEHVCSLKHQVSNKDCIPVTIEIQEGLDKVL